MSNPITFLKRLWGRLAGPGDTLYRPSETAIFRYWDGEGVRRADPLVLYRRYKEVEAVLAVDMQLASSPLMKEDKQVEALGRVAEAARKVFGLRPVDDKGGVAEVACIEILNAFLEYVGGVKKNSGPSPTPPDSSAGPAPSTAAGPPTSASSDSGSTATSPSCAPPSPSPSASAPPWGATPAAASGTP